MVLINGVKFDWQPVISGVIQCSVLGTLRFLIYINDISNGIIDPSQFLLFADDLKLYCSSTDLGLTDFDFIEFFTIISTPRSQDKI